MKETFTFFVCLSVSTLMAQDPPEMEKPDEHHKHLRMMTGTWAVKSKFHTIPGQIIEMNGMEVSKMQPGGFWLISDFTGKILDRTFHGHSVMGYEAHRKKYIGTWADSFGSVLVTTTGTCSKNGQITTMVGKGYDQMQKREITYKQVYEIKNANNRTYHMYDVRGKNEKLIMESVYQRRAAKLGLNTKLKGSFTHEISGPFATVYYLGGPQQARPPEGRFKPGTRVRVVRNVGSYCIVESENGITAHVSTGALKPLKRK
tara:strand:- start:247 stop:1023 length:777 start_codon:yes stop_codon:yes gene_type:complete